jgi:carbonic anhydrase
MAHHWGYHEDNGPETWLHVAPAAKGLHQSPINIKTDDAEFEASLRVRPLRIEYVPENSKKLTNNGHSVQVTIDGEGSVLEGGPYRHTYRAEQFHFHWGQASHEGSEHLIDGEAYAAELHIVHWNCDLFSSFAEASKSANGLAVLGVFIKLGEEHEGLNRLVELLRRVRFAGDEVDIDDGFDPACLLPADRDKYWTYSGSLTTPPCYESVRFLLFKDPIEVSERQLRAFRRLREDSRREELAEALDDDQEDEDLSGHIVNNYRPIHPLHDRKVLASFCRD